MEERIDGQTVELMETSGRAGGPIKMSRFT